MKRPQAIAFDLYNTLLQITQQKHPFSQIYQAARLKEQGISQKGYRKLLMTVEIEDVMEQLPTSFAEAYRKYQPVLQQELASVKCFPETLETLEDLSSKVDLYLISNLATPYKKPFFELGLASFFKGTIFSCEVGSMKPQQGIFQLVEKRSGLKGNKLLMVGDSHTADVAGAKSRKWSFLKVNRATRCLRDFEIGTLAQIRHRWS